MGSLSLLQVIFPAQELNQGLLHCRWILNQLSTPIFEIHMNFLKQISETNIRNLYE